MSRAHHYQVADLQAHDLVWGMQPEQLPNDAPGWAVACLEQGMPVVVRRDERRPGLLAVGLRGSRREQRYAGWMQASEVTRRVCPEEIRRLQTASAAVQDTLSVIEQIFCGLAWGITGSHAYQELTGQPVTRVASDLDVLLRLSQPVRPAQAANWLALLEPLPVRADIQVECGRGGFSLRDWHAHPDRVLLKTGAGAVLTGNPWA